MMRTIALFLFSSLSLFAGDNWPGVAFKAVRAYAWPADTETEAVVLPDKRLLPGVLNRNGASLTLDQLKHLRAAVTGQHAGLPVFACYVPHNAFVFDASKKPVAFVEVCFSCLGYRAEPKGAAESFDLLALAEIFGEHRLPMGEYRDFLSFKKAFKAIVNGEAPKDTSGGLAPNSGSELVPGRK
jgi:hypothetical protein